MKPHVKPDGARRQRIGADRLEPPPDDRLLQDERHDEQDRDGEVDGVPDAPRVSAGDCRQQGGCRSRNAAGDGEHPAIDQRIHADRGDDRVQPHEADQHAVHDAGGERAAQRQQHRGQEIGVVAGRNVS